MALTEEQKQKLVTFWSREIGTDINKQIDFAFKTEAEKIAQITAWSEAEKAKLESDKSLLNTTFLNEEKAKIDSKIQEVEDAKTILDAKGKLK